MRKEIGQRHSEGEDRMPEVLRSHLDVMHRGEKTQEPRAWGPTLLQLQNTFIHLEKAPSTQGKMLGWLPLVLQHLTEQ